MSAHRPALRYHGGKWMLAPWIISQMPTHRIYVEPFGGAASVLMRKPRAYAEVYNELAGEITNVFRQLRDRPDELERVLRLTPFSRAEFESSYNPADDLLEQARRTIFRSMAGFSSAAANGNYGTGFRANSNRSGTTPARDWMNYPAAIKSFAERLQGVVIEKRDAGECMVQHDSSRTLHFVDPPYVHETRRAETGRNATYAHELTDDDHRALADTLRRLNGMVILCGYPSALYDNLFGDWPSIERPAYADGARERTEVLWFNPAAWKARPQQQLFEASR
jgi:DNA adenine methylase